MGRATRQGRRNAKEGQEPPKAKVTPEQRAITAARQSASKTPPRSHNKWPMRIPAYLPLVAKPCSHSRKARRLMPKLALDSQAMGLPSSFSDGSYRMTPTGRAVVSAMQAGDYQRAVDAISRGSDTSAKRTEAPECRQNATGSRHSAPHGSSDL